MNSTCTIQTDQKKKITLESNILYALWLTGAGHAGGKARLEVRTTFVGEGATIEIVGKSEKGKKLGKIKDTITRNHYVGELDIPEKIDPDDTLYFEAKLPKHGLKMESNGIPVKPTIIARSMSWDKQEVRRGDTVKLTCDFQSGVMEGEEATVIIYEYSPEGHHDKVVAIPTQAKGNRIEVLWEYQYHAVTTQIATEAERQKYGKHYSHPKYFFVVAVDDERIGVGQESGLLAFVDVVEVELRDSLGRALVNKKFTLTLADGTAKDGTTDGQGRARLEGLSPGAYTIRAQGIRALRVQV